jgi:hypothetical protein
VPLTQHNALDNQRPSPPPPPPPKKKQPRPHPAPRHVLARPPGAAPHDARGSRDARPHPQRRPRPPAPSRSRHSGARQARAPVSPPVLRAPRRARPADVPARRVGRVSDARPSARPPGGAPDGRPRPDPSVRRHVRLDARRARVGRESFSVGVHARRARAGARVLRVCVRGTEGGARVGAGRGRRGRRQAAGLCRGDVQRRQRL